MSDVAVPKCLEIHFDDNSAQESLEICPVDSKECKKEGHSRRDNESTHTELYVYHSSPSPPPKPELNDLTDMDGVPFHPQSIKIDFTPIPGIDDEYELQQKCVDFWKFVESHPEIHSLLVIPDPTLSAVNIEVEKEPEVEDEVSSAVSTYAGVDYMDMDDKVKLAFMTKDKCKGCMSINDGSYQDLYHEKNSKMTSTKLKRLGWMMDEFDKRNPKSFEPPLASPTLVKAQLQRLPPMDAKQPTLKKDPCQCQCKCQFKPPPNSMK